MDTLSTALIEKPESIKRGRIFLFHLRLIFMIDDKVPPLCCLWGQTVVGASVQSGKSFYETFDLPKKKGKTPELSTRTVFQASRQPRRMQEWAFVFSLLSLCFCHISAPASHQAELLVRWMVFFPRHICCCLCRHRYLCQDLFVASTPVRGETGELIINNASIFIFFAT